MRISIFLSPSPGRHRRLFRRGRVTAGFFFGMGGGGWGGVVGLSRLRLFPFRRLDRLEAELGRHEGAGGSEATAVLTREELRSASVQARCLIAASGFRQSQFVE